MDGWAMIRSTNPARAHLLLRRAVRAGVHGEDDMTDAPNIDRCKLFRGSSRAEIEAKIDAFLEEGPPFRDVPLVLAIGSGRFTHRGISIREWHRDGNVRFDAAVEISE
jgi:hypothetical protein